MRNKTHPFRWLIRCAGCMLTVMLLTAVSGCDMPDKSSPSYPADNGIDYRQNPSQVKTILGIWTAQSVTVNGEVYSIGEYSDLKREDFSSTYTIQPDGTVILSNNSQSLEGTYSFDGKAVEALFGKYHYRLMYDAQANTLTRTKEATDEVITYRKH